MKFWNALLEFGSEWGEEGSMPLKILQKIFQAQTEDLTTIGTHVAQIVESSDEQMELSNTESDVLYDNVQEQIKIKINDCITFTNVWGFRT